VLANKLETVIALFTVIIYIIGSLNKVFKQNKLGEVKMDVRAVFDFDGCNHLDITVESNDGNHIVSIDVTNDITHCGTYQGGLNAVQAIVACCNACDHPAMIITDDENPDDDNVFEVKNVNGDVVITIQGSSMVIVEAKSLAVAQSLLALCAVAQSSD
jgi:hypothetical protein